MLKATATKAGGFGKLGGKWTAKRNLNIIRGLLPESGEYNHTLEIENTWPGKIMYNITLPYKVSVYTLLSLEETLNKFWLSRPLLPERAFQCKRSWTVSIGFAY
jgi:hypothetical protein